MEPSTTMAFVSVIDGTTQGKMHGRGVARTGKGITLMNDIIRIIKSLENQVFN